MTSATPPPPPGGTGEPGIASHLPALIASLLGYFRARLELAGIEGREAAQIYLKVGFLLVLAVMLLAFGYAFLWIGLIGLIATLAHVFWGWIVLLVAVLHFFGVGGALWGISMLWKKEVFKATLEEFRKDQEWLNRHTNT